MNAPLAAAQLPVSQDVLWYKDAIIYQLHVKSFCDSNNDGIGDFPGLISKLDYIADLGVTFYNAFNDQVLLYGKTRSPREDMILVAVNLDPHHVQEATFEVPLWEWGLADDASIAVQDLMRDQRFVWTGKTQQVRLDPADLPFAIWRLSPLSGGAP